MTQFASWVLFPLVMALLCLGCGVVVEAGSGRKLPEGLRLPVGLALILVVAEITTKTSTTASWTVPLVVIIALAGLVVSRPWVTRPWREGWWPLARRFAWPLLAALAVYLVFVAPVMFSGLPTFNGFIKLDDTATWMGMTDRALTDGHSLAGLPQSTYEAMLYFYLRAGSGLSALGFGALGGGEPVGAQLPWGIGARLVGQDIAWVFQPYMAFLGAMLALSAWSLIGPLVRSRALRALVVFIAAQAALIYGYSLWGGVKEVAATWALVLTVACVVPIFEGEARVRSFLPMAAAVLAMLGILGFGGAVWLPLTLLVVAVFAVRLWVRRLSRGQLAWLLAGAVALAVVLIVAASNFVSNNGALTASTELGNLPHRIRPLQLFGIWPATDFRIDPPNASGLAYLLIGIVFMAACLGFATAWRARFWTIPLYLAAALIGVLLVTVEGSPWVQGKAFAIASPALLLAALTGAVALLERGFFPWETRLRTGGLLSARRVLAVGGALAISVGVLWSNVLQYGHVTLAPYGQMSELSYIGQHFAGQGPTMINENEPYAGRHFLRTMAPESPSDLRRRALDLRNGQQLNKGDYADLDRFQLPGLLIYRTIVMRTSPSASRPPVPYQLVYNGRWYQVWQRRSGVLSRPVIDSIPLGDQFDPIGTPNCTQVLRLARKAGPNGLLAAPSRIPPTGVGPTQPLQTGTLKLPFQISIPGQYEIWLGGSFSGHLTARADGKELSSTGQVMNEPGGYTPLGKVHFGAATHRVTLSYTSGGLGPGSAGPGGANDAPSAGPVEIATPAGNIPVTYIAPADARALCGKQWDWIEALGA